MSQIHASFKVTSSKWLKMNAEVVKSSKSRYRYKIVNLSMVIMARNVLKRSR